MRSLALSATYTFPAASTAIPVGWFNWALVAGPLSPLNPAVPFPATVVITPFETLKMRLSLGLAMYSAPAESTAMPLKPKKQHDPVTVVIAPSEILRILGLCIPVSVTYRLPLESTATPSVKSKPLATVTIRPFQTLRISPSPPSAKYTVPAESTAMPYEIGRAHV